MTDLHHAGPGRTPMRTDNPDKINVLEGPSATKPPVGDTPSPLSTGMSADGSAGLPSYMDGLTPDNRSLFENKGWKDMNDALSSYDALSKKLGSSVNLPGTEASEDDWQKFYARLGCPSDKDGYHFNLPDGLDENFPYDHASASEFKSWAKNAGLTPRQADSLHGDYVRMQAAQINEMNQKFEQSEAQAHEQLSHAWGGETSEKFQANVGYAQAALNSAGEEVTDALQDAGLLSEDGNLRNAAIGLWLAKLGAQYYADDSFAASPYSSMSRNPFVPDESGKTNLTEEARIMKSDPHRAIALIRAAGREKDFAGFMK